MTDDQDLAGFRAPPMQRPTPTAIRLAGARLYQHAVELQVPSDVPILELPIPDDLPGLQKDRRLMQWYVHLTDPDGG